MNHLIQKIRKFDEKGEQEGLADSGVWLSDTGLFNNKDFGNWLSFPNAEDTQEIRKQNNMVFRELREMNICCFIFFTFYTDPV